MADNISEHSSFVLIVESDVQIITEEECKSRGPGLKSIDLPTMEMKRSFNFHDLECKFRAVSYVAGWIELLLPQHLHHGTATLFAAIFGMAMFF